MKAPPHGLRLLRWARQVPAVHPRPIFLLGHPKSGTTVIATLLADISGETITDDLFRTARIQRSEVTQLFDGSLSVADFVRRHPGSFATRLNKCPKLTYFFEPLRRCFPQARFIYIIRDPRAALRSFLGWRTIPGDAESLQDPAQLQRVEVLPCQPTGHYIDRLAQRWNQAADVYLHEHGNLSLVRYEDFLRQPLQAIQELSLEVGLVPRHDISGRVHRRHKLSGVRDIPYREFFGAANLARIESICGDRMSTFGYA